MLKVLYWVGAGLIGGSIGAGVWAAITYNTGYELGIVAWGVGLLVGFGVRAAAQGGVGQAPGLVAAVVALACVLGGKYITVWLVVDDVVDLSGVAMSDELIISFIADDVAVEWEDEGRRVDWPNGLDPADASEEADYPADVWAEATGRWDSWAPEDQESYRTDLEAWASDSLGVRSELSTELFMQSFSLFDVLWILLALGTAYRVGSGWDDE